eukprot:1142676-Pelagomonas_calceolata.AAC.5
MFDHYVDDHEVAWLELCCFLLHHYVSYCRIPDVRGKVCGLLKIAGQGVTKIASGRLEECLA